MPKPTDENRLRDMLLYAEKTLKYGGGKTRPQLEKDEVLSLALVRLLEIIGEAAARVSDTTRDQCAQIPWKIIVGMRNRIVHGYDQIDFEIVTRTINEDLQPLVQELRAILAHETNEDLSQS